MLKSSPDRESFLCFNDHGTSKPIVAIQCAHFLFVYLADKLFRKFCDNNGDDRMHKEVILVYSFK